ncbi:hypothetical protein [Cellulomonas bogoriensis]|nr:hypothetical protein [Cellulomonas bogoriensis]
MASGPHAADDPSDEAPDERGPRGTPGDRGQGGLDDPQEVETRWQEIVAQLGDLTPPGDRPAPAAADPGDGGADTADRPRAVEDPAAERPAPSPPTGPRAWTPDPEVEEAENHFEPPEPGPVLAGDPVLTLGWGLVVASVATILAIALVWRGAPSAVLVLAGGSLLAGAGLLLWRMPQGRDHDDGNGAVV